MDPNKSERKKRKADQAFKQFSIDFDQPASKSPKGTPRWRNGDHRKSSHKEVTFSEDPKSLVDHYHHNSAVTQSGPGHQHTVTSLRQRASELLQTRQNLPIWNHSKEILNKVRDNDVLLLVGETGSGKSTQIPQFLLSLCRQTTITKSVGTLKGAGGLGGKVGGRIAITQPRRVAAISLARRVAEEMGSTLGRSSPNSQVGYSVRFDNNHSAATKVKFVTDGMLLQELVRDPWLKEYSVVVVDEVHERGLNVDLVLGFLKRLIVERNLNDGRGGVPLKVVVMSATADMEKIQSFFDCAKVGTMPQDQVEEGGDRGEKEKVEAQEVSESTAPAVKVTSCYIKGRQYPVKTHYTSLPVTNVLDTALERIIDIHTHSPLPGDILVFLPGQETIDTMESMCVSYAQSLAAKSKEKGAPRLPKLLILPLFAALPTALQQRVFEKTPAFTRKIILSTNIAETSVTVPGIRHVVDTGKRKARFFRPGLNLDTLLTKAISRSSANQRAGRAGREAPGNCYRLYTEKTFYELDADTEPEIQRCDLSQLVLILKSHGVENILTFPLLTPPPLKALERALLHLLKLKALNRKDGQITSLGQQMSTLPLPANLARILLASQLPQYNCLEEIIDIVSGLSVENIWLPIHDRSHNQRQTQPLTPHQNSGTSNTDNDDTHNDTINHNHDNDDNSDDETSQDPILQARSTLYRREGDHLTLLSAIQSYVLNQSDRGDFCRRHAISHRAMRSILDIRKQLRNLFIDTKSKKYKPLSTTDHKTENKDEDLSTRILKTLLLGLGDRVAYLNPKQSQNQQGGEKGIWTGPYTTLSNQGKNLQIHPSSVLFGRGHTAAGSGGGRGGGTAGGGGVRPAWIMFTEFVVTQRAYARGVSVVEAAWLDEVDEDEDGENE